MATPLFFSLKNPVYQWALPGSRIHPLDPLHWIHNIPNTEKGEMSQSHHGENSNSFNNNNFNNKTNLNSFNTSSFNNTNNMFNLNLGSVDETAEVLAWLFRWNPGYGTRILEPTESKMWETSCYEQRIGLTVFKVANPIIRPCSSTEIRGLGRTTLGKKLYSP